MIFSLSDYSETAYLFVRFSMKKIGARFLHNPIINYASIFWLKLYSRSLSVEEG